MFTSPQFFNSLIIFLIPFFITACGGGSGSSSQMPSMPADPPEIAVGQFKDSSTEGISYQSGFQSGVTLADGSFNYEVGRPVTFSIGGVTLGTAIGKDVITPVDLVESGDINTNEVTNIVRFLMMLDTDGNPVNGITIAKDIRNFAVNWEQVDFGSNDFASELISIRSDLVSIGGTLNDLPTTKEATEHVGSTLLCQYTGLYTGTFSGDDEGRFGFYVYRGADSAIVGTDPVDGPIAAWDKLNLGPVEGIVYSTFNEQEFYLENIKPIAPEKNDNKSLLFESEYSGQSFNRVLTGDIYSPDGKLQGDWSDDSLSGSL